MSDWTTTHLGALTNFQKGVKVEVFDNEEPGSVPYLGAGALETGEPTQYAMPRRAVLAEVGDVLMLWDGERSGLVGGRQSGVVSSTVSRLRPARGVDSDYLRHALQLQFGWIQSRRTGTGVPHVPKDLSTWLSIAHPVDPSEQASIARVLDCIDEEIRETLNVASKLASLKRGLVIELLTARRSDIGDGETIDTPVGTIPKSWSVKRLCQMLAPVEPAMRSGPFGSALLKHELVNSGIPLLGIDNVHKDRFVRDYKRFVTPAKAAELARYCVFPDDVMITIMGTVGRACLVPSDVGHALSSKHVWTMTFDQKQYLPYLIMTQLNHAPWVLAQLRKDEQGGIMSAIRSETLKSIVLPVPPIDEQQRIASTLQSLDQRMAGEAETLRKLRAMKAGLARNLLSGSVRLPRGMARD